MTPSQARMIVLTLYQNGRTANVAKVTKCRNKNAAKRTIVAYADSIGKSVRFTENSGHLYVHTANKTNAATLTNLDGISEKYRNDMVLI